MTGVPDELRAWLVDSWRALAAAGLLLILSNGPVLRFAGVLDRPGLWNDLAVWPFFAGAAVASAGLAWAVWRPGGPRAGPVSRAGMRGPRSRAPRWQARATQPPPRPATISRLALVAIVWYSAAAVASSGWSVYPSATLWRSVVYLGLLLLGLALAGLDPDELSATLVFAAGAAVAGSLAAVVLRHEDAIDGRGDWMGIYTNRNSLAPMAALGVIAGLRWLVSPTPARSQHGVEGVESPTGAIGSGHSVVYTGSAGLGPALSPAVRRVWGAALVVTSLAALIGAGSRTAWLALAAALASAVALGAAAGAARTRRWGPRRTAAALWGGALAAAGACAAVAAAAWNVSTLSQRRAIWGLAWDRVLERPWGGHGFFAFWEVPELVQEHELLQLGSAHNSLVETALGLGVLGTAPFVMLVVLAAVNAGRGLWLHPSADTGMWAAVTVFVLLENVTESFVLWFSHIWVLLLAAALRPRAIGTASPPATGPAPAGSQPPLIAGAGT